MRPYEAMVVLRPDLDQEALEAVQARLTSVITDQGGQITHVDPWGKRRLAYEINGHTEGFYVVIKFQGNPGITTELERIMRITDSVMRFLVVRDEFPTAVSQSAGKADAQAAQADSADAGEATDAQSEAAESAGEVAATDAAEAKAEDAAAEEAEQPAEQAEEATEKQN